MFNRDLAARWISKIFREKYPSSGDAPPDEIYREYAELLYSGVLKRDGDSPAIDQYEEWLRRNNSVEDFVGLLRQFRNSPESLNLRVWNRKNANREPQEKVHAILSVGAHCITSYTLKKHALRSFSGPFDWIFSNLGMASHCIADDFRTFWTEHISPKFRRNTVYLLMRNIATTYFIRKSIMYRAYSIIST